MKLICFPPAGASSTAYRPWHRQAHRFDGVVALDYPGHGRNTPQRLEESVSEIVSALLSQLRSVDAVTGSVLFGHSFGGLVAFELCTRLEWHERPALVVLSACAYPTPTEGRRVDASALIRKYDYRVAANPDLMQLVLPVLQSDLDAAYSYAPSDTAHVAAPFLLVHASRDPEVDATSMAPWLRHADGPRFARQVSGDHFYIDEPHEVLSIIADIVDTVDHGGVADV